MWYVEGAMQGDSAHLLIVEDDDQLAELLQEYLGLHGFQLSRVSSGDAGVEAILESQPELVILDLLLPGANGLDVCRQVRDRYPGAIQYFGPAEGSNAICETLRLEGESG